jgi:protein ImuB
MHFEEAIELESPVETLESLSFLLNRLLDQLCARLEARALAVQELTLRLQLERRVADEEATTEQELHGIVSPDISHIVAHNNICHRTLELPVAMRDAKVFLKLLQLELDAHQPGAPVVKIWITAKPAPPRSVQRGLFLPVTPEAEKLEITLARITGIVGERRAGIAHLLDTYRRDSFRVERFAAKQEGRRDTFCASTTMWDLKDSPVIALRIFRPARRLRVEVNEGFPTWLAAMTNESDLDELQGKILWAAGPWCSSGDWWSKQPESERINSKDEVQPWDREEWDVALGNQSSGVALYRIYRDPGSGQWFADASYD